jgi:hypothetical protein
VLAGKVRRCALFGRTRPKHLRPAADKVTWRSSVIDRRSSAGCHDREALSISRVHRYVARHSGGRLLSETHGSRNYHCGLRGDVRLSCDVVPDDGYADCEGVCGFTLRIRPSYPGRMFSGCMRRHFHRPSDYPVRGEHILIAGSVLCGASRYSSIGNWISTSCQALFLSASVEFSVHRRHHFAESGDLYAEEKAVRC